MIRVFPSERADVWSVALALIFLRSSRLVIFKNGKKAADFVGLRQANVLVDALRAAK